MNDKQLIIPRANVTVRAATTADLRDVDALQKAHSKELGFLHTATLEGKVARGEMLVAHAANGQFAGYVVGSDTYHKREEVGVVYQMAVAAAARRGNVGATLLRTLFESWAYGTRLCCAWCAQDLAANKFWEAMGFVPLAYRAGSAGKGRVHIFWQKRINQGDAETKWWYPSITGSGAIREDRVVLPIPEGQHWSDARPTVLPTVTDPPAVEVAEKVVKATGKLAWPKGVEERDGVLYEDGIRLVTAETLRREQGSGPGGLFMVPAGAKLVREMPKQVAVAARKKTVKKAPAKHDPRMASAVRELRDRWLEHVNGSGRLLPSNERYAVGRPPMLTAGQVERLGLPTPEGRRLLAA